MLAIFCSRPVRPKSAIEMGFSRASLCGPLTFVIGAMWGVFAISYAIYDRASASKLADLAFYASMAVATPIAGYLAFRASRRIKCNSLNILLFATLTYVIIAISTFMRSSVFLFSSAAIYLTTASALLLFQRANHDPQHDPQKAAFSQWIWIPNLAAVISVASFLALALRNLNPYFYWPTQDVGFNKDVTRYGPNVKSSSGGCSRCAGHNSSDWGLSLLPQGYRSAYRDQ